MHTCNSKDSALNLRTVGRSGRLTFGNKAKRFAVKDEPALYCILLY